MNDLLKVIAAFVNAEQLGGWVRALVATILGAASGWFGGALMPFLTPEFQVAFGVVVSTVVVGVWSQIAKKISAA